VNEAERVERLARYLYEDYLLSIDENLRSPWGQAASEKVDELWRKHASRAIEVMEGRAEIPVFHSAAAWVSAFGADVDLLVEKGRILRQLRGAALPQDELVRFLLKEGKHPACVLVVLGRLGRT
jgi:hypothetical protein